MNILNINGKKIEVAGNNISVQGSQVIVDGKVIAGDLSGEVTIKWEGDLANLDCRNVTVSGDVAGDINCRNITCSDVAGSIQGRNITCVNHSGNINL